MVSFKPAWHWQGSDSGDKYVTMYTETDLVLDFSKNQRLVNGIFAPFFPYFIRKSL